MPSLTRRPTITGKQLAVTAHSEESGVYPGMLETLLALWSRNDHLTICTTNFTRVFAFLYRSIHTPWLYFL